MPAGDEGARTKEGGDAKDVGRKGNLRDWGPPSPATLLGAAGPGTGFEAGGADHIPEGHGLTWLLCSPGDVHQTLLLCQAKQRAPRPVSC